MPHGPVLQDYKFILESAEQHGVIQTEDFDDGTTIVRIGDQEPVKRTRAVFTADEKTTVHDVLKRWGGATASALSDYTHELPAWNRTAHARKISYLLALVGEADNDALRRGKPPET